MSEVKVNIDPIQPIKKKTIHRKVYENDVLVEEKTFEVTDWDQYWTLSFDGEEKAPGSGFVFDKETYPNIQNAKDALKAWQFEREQEKVRQEAEAKEKRRQHRLEVKKAKEARNASHG